MRPINQQGTHCLCVTQILEMRRNLGDAGFSQGQCDALTEGLANILAGLATKADLQELRAEMNGRFAEVESKIAEVKNEIADLKVSTADSRASTAKWAVGIIAATLLGFAGMSVAIVLSLGRLAG